MPGIVLPNDRLMVELQSSFLTLETADDESVSPLKVYLVAFRQLLNASSSLAGEARLVVDVEISILLNTSRTRRPLLA